MNHFVYDKSGYGLHLSFSISTRNYPHTPLLGTSIVEATVVVRLTSI